MYGWNKRLLRIDLSNKKITKEDLNPKVAKDYIGGRGLGIYYMLKEMKPKTDPFSEDNLLIMAVGPLTGSNAATGARYMVMTKSPLTGGITCSNAGGLFPRELKKCGYEAIIIKGKSEKPTYLFIDKTQNKIELRSASHIWGKNTHETTDILLKETDEKAKVACIGQGGERLVLFASIMNDKDRAAGRSGVGAVMGSKNLKAVVVKGDKFPEKADEQGFKEFHKKVLKKFNDSVKKVPSSLRIYGTAGVVATTQSYGVLPTKNWQQGTFDGWEKIQGSVLTEKYLIKNKSCFACPIGCGRLTEVKEKGFEGKGEGPEYETIYAMGSNCMIENLAAITKANYLCNEFGIDTITMGATLACAMELYEKGIITDKETERPLKWGDAELLVELTRKTALREGFGNLLADGSFRLAQKFGVPELAMVSKKQEFPGYEPRGEQGMGLAYATSPIGGSHMRGDPAYFELFGVPKSVDPLEYKSKARLIKIWQDLSAILDSAGLCIFFVTRMLVDPVLEVHPTGIMKYLNAACGADYTIGELEKCGERIFNAERAFLVREGFSKKDDSLPDRLTKEPAPTGPAKGHICHLDEMLEEYYKERGWDKNGIPLSDKLKELGVVG